MVLSCSKKFVRIVQRLQQNYEEKEMTKLTDKEINFYERQKICHIWKEKFCYDENNGK